MPETPQQRERQLQVRGMLWLALVVLLACVLRAWRGHMFGAGWWKP